MSRLLLVNVTLVVIAAVAVGQTPTETLVKQLTDSSPRVRRLAAEKLGREKAGDAAPAISALLQDPDADVRAAAQKALVRIGPKSVAPLAKVLGAGDESARLVAVQALAELGTTAEDAVPALTAALKDKNVDVRIYAAFVLGQIGPAAKSALPALREAAGDTSNLGSGHRYPVPNSLAPTAMTASLSIDPKSSPSLAESAVPKLTKALASEQPADVQAAADALATLGIQANSALPELENVLPKHSLDAKSSIESAIDKLKGDRGEQERTATDRSQPIERRLKALDKMRYRTEPSEKHVAAVEALLTDPSPEVRLAALKAVATGQVRSKAITVGLIGLLNDEAVHAADQQQLSRQEVVSALSHMGKAAAPELVAVLADPKQKPDIRFQVGDILLKMGTRARGVLPQIEACTKDRYLVIAMMASCASIRAGGDSTGYRDVLKQGLRHKVPEIASLTASTVGQLGPLATDLIPDLTTLLEHEDREVQIAAARGLSRMGPAAAKAVPAMAALLKSDDARQRSLVTSALSEMGSDAKAAVPELTARLKDVGTMFPDPTLKTLGNLGPDAAQATAGLLAIAKNPKLRQENVAFLVLAQIGPAAKEAIPLLVDRLTARSRHDRQAAAKALGVFGPIAKEAVPKLRELLDDPDEPVRVWSAFALARITGEVDANVKEMLSYWVEPVARRGPARPLTESNFDIAEALDRLGPDAKPARDWVLRVAGNPQLAVGTNAHLCHVLSNLNDAEAIPQLIARLKQAEPTNSWTTAAVLDTLGTFGPKAKSAKKAVEALLEHDTPEVADAAARALRRIDPPVR